MNIIDSPFLMCEVENLSVGDFCLADQSLTPAILVSNMEEELEFLALDYSGRGFFNASGRVLKLSSSWFLRLPAEASAWASVYPENGGLAVAHSKFGTYFVHSGEHVDRYVDITNGRFAECIGHGAVFPLIWEIAIKEHNRWKTIHHFSQPPFSEYPR